MSRIKPTKMSRILLILLPSCFLVLIAAQNFGPCVPLNVPVRCPYSFTSCGPFMTNLSIMSNGLQPPSPGRRFGLSYALNASACIFSYPCAQICDAGPCLNSSCDSLCINSNSKFLADGNWNCTGIFDNSTKVYGAGTTCTGIGTCCMECDGGENYFYGEYGKAKTPMQYRCQDNNFVPTAICAGTKEQISWTLLVTVTLLGCIMMSML